MGKTHRPRPVVLLVGLALGGCTFDRLGLPGASGGSVTDGGAGQGGGGGTAGDGGGVGGGGSSDASGDRGGSGGSGGGSGGSGGGSGGSGGGSGGSGGGSGGSGGGSGGSGGGTGGSGGGSGTCGYTEPVKNCRDSIACAKECSDCKEVAACRALLTDPMQKKLAADYWECACTTCFDAYTDKGARKECVCKNLCSPSGKCAMQTGACVGGPVSSNPECASWGC